MDVKKTQLFKKIYGALIGSAIGDAMGGPVEMYYYPDIIKKHGWVNSLLAYDDINPSVHGPWSKEAGSYTDDSRMSKIFLDAILSCNGVPDDTDIKKAYIDYYYNAKEGMPKEFIEEYFMKAIYGDRKQIFGGQPTNGAIMGIAPFGVINPCNPQKALDDAFKAAFMVEGYARYSAAAAAAAISAAMIPGIKYDKVIELCFASLNNHKKKVEGELWRNCHMYPHVAMKNEKLVRECITIADKYEDTSSLRKELLEKVEQQFFADGAETLAIAVTMFYKTKGDFKASVEACVNFGRDNDSSASVVGAIAGAFNGVDSIPQEWIKLVETVNDGPSFEDFAEKLTIIVMKALKEQSNVLKNVSSMM
ncbi:MAG: ADP-ribosylglycohydrolase family protein [Tenericutes bacterium]|nr:ADP-ribosylglycohydrolase family protein [Mycoplasmatota bacterium]